MRAWETFWYRFCYVYTMNERYTRLHHCHSRAWLDRRMLRSRRWIIWMMTAVTCISQLSSFLRLAISCLFQGHRVSTGPRPWACQFTSGPGLCLRLY